MKLQAPPEREAYDHAVPSVAQGCMEKQHAEALNNSETFGRSLYYAG
jgi:hypothetical protein